MSCNVSCQPRVLLSETRLSAQAPHLLSNVMELRWTWQPQRTQTYDPAASALSAFASTAFTCSSSINAYCAPTPNDVPSLGVDPFTSEMPCAAFDLPVAVRVMSYSWAHNRPDQSHVAHMCQFCAPPTPVPLPPHGPGAVFDSRAAVRTWGVPLKLIAYHGHPDHPSMSGMPCTSPVSLPH